MGSGLPLVFIFLSAAFAQDGFNASSYQRPMLHAIRDVSEEIRAVKSTSDPVFLGLGRSPAPMMAALESAGERVVNLPFSDGALWEGRIRKGDLQAELDLYRSVRPHLEQHLRGAIGAGREVVLVDYAASGRTYSLGYRLIRRYLMEVCPACKLKGAVLTDNDAFLDLRAGSPLEKGAPPEGVKVVDLSRSGSRQNLANALARGDYKRIAPYGAFSIDPSALKDAPKGPVKPSIDYEVFKTWFKNTAPLRPEGAQTPGTCASEATGSTSAGRAAGGKGLSGLSNFLGLWSGFSMFLPAQNPYADPKGVDCSEALAAREEMRCRWDSKWNPVNNEVICTQVLSIQEIPSTSAVRLCSVRTRLVSFVCSSETCKSDFNLEKLPGPGNRRRLSDEETLRWLRSIQEKYSVKVESQERSFPEHMRGI